MGLPCTRVSWFRWIFSWSPASLLSGPMLAKHALRLAQGAAPHRWRLSLSTPAMPRLRGCAPGSGRRCSCTASKPVPLPVRRLSTVTAALGAAPGLQREWRGATAALACWLRHAQKRRRCGRRWRAPRRRRSAGARRMRRCGRTQWAPFSASEATMGTSSSGEVLRMGGRDNWAGETTVVLSILVYFRSETSYVEACSSRALFVASFVPCYPPACVSFRLPSQPRHRSRALAHERRFGAAFVVADVARRAFL